VQFQPTIQHIKTIVSEHYGVSISLLNSARRARAIARPRQVGMYLSARYTGRSLPEIGRAYGGRDHTTVMHAAKKVTELIGQQPEFKKQVDFLTSVLSIDGEIIENPDMPSNLKAAADKARLKVIEAALRIPDRTANGNAKQIARILTKYFGMEKLYSASTKTGTRIEVYVSAENQFAVLECDGDDAHLMSAGFDWAEHMPTAELPTPEWPKSLPCLKCPTLVLSQHAGDRLCSKCRKSNNRVENGTAEGVVG